MKNIMLCCAAGMSTSMLVTKMEKSAEEQNIEVNIWAMSFEEAKNNVGKADVVLLGPQVRYLAPAMKALTDEHGIQTEVINPMDYGMMKGEAVLKQALSLIVDN